ncbi:MAG: altronate dehydratase family protein [Oscillospiraceae bacterium]|nr:altronate dehydratase family protein [Oscillospiraceae bacterium]
MKLYQIDPADSVAVALEEIQAGEEHLCGAVQVTALEQIPKGHKIALRDIAKGAPILKYGSAIGAASQNIQKGQWVHVHNTVSCADESHDYTYRFDPACVQPTGTSERTFRGYRRKNGAVGVRNYILVISGVFCANPHIKQFVRSVEEKFPKCSSFDGVLPLTHECGCGQDGQDLENVRKALAGIMANGNVGGVLFVEVGCEINYLETITQYMGPLDPSRIRRVTMQKVDEEYAEMERCLAQLYDVVRQDVREDCPLSALHVAANCGGSDAFSGLTSNKLLGDFGEYLVKNGGTYSITEVTEMFGAEQILMNHAADAAVFEKVRDLIAAQRAYIARYGSTANGNPSYGNKLGGLTTIEDKSLGCVQKGGKCAVSDVVYYGDRVKTNGFQLVQGPGSDLIGVTGQIAAGAVLVLFSTGRGTPVSFAAPTLKIASNTALYEKKTAWMDFNAGARIDGKDRHELLEEFIQLVIQTASGTYQGSNERMGFYEIALFRDGVIL